MAFSAPLAAVLSTDLHISAAVQFAGQLAHGISRTLGGARPGAAGRAPPAAGRHGADSASGAEPERGPLGDTASVTLAVERSPPVDVGVRQDRRSLLMATG